MAEPGPDIPDEVPHPLNAPGPFWVARDQCISCRTPEAEAPDLMAYDEDAWTCYFRRQPATPAEIDQAIMAMAVACCDSLCYDGEDPAVLARFAALGVGVRRPVPWPRPRRETGPPESGPAPREA